MKYLTFKEFLAKQLTKTTLFEMAYSRQKAMDEVSALRDTILNHILKVVLFSEHQDAEHWKVELDVYISLVDEIVTKPKNRKLKYEDYFELLFGGPFGHPEGIERRVKNLYKTKRISSLPNVNYDNLQERIEHLYEELCDDLAIGMCKDVDDYLSFVKDNF